LFHQSSKTHVFFTKPRSFCGLDYIWHDGAAPRFQASQSGILSQAASSCLQASHAGKPSRAQERVPEGARRKDAERLNCGSERTLDSPAKKISFDECVRFAVAGAESVNTAPGLEPFFLVFVALWENSMSCS
jgi:hypothetical protein